MSTNLESVNLGFTLKGVECQPEAYTLKMSILVDTKPKTDTFFDFLPSYFLWALNHFKLMWHFLSRFSKNHDIFCPTLIILLFIDIINNLSIFLFNFWAEIYIVIYYMSFQIAIQRCYFIVVKKFSSKIFISSHSRIISPHNLR